MRFAHPHILWLLLLLPVVGLFAWARLRAGSRALERALSPGMSARLTQHLATGRRMMGLLLLLLTCLFLILGAARPQRGTQYVKASRRGIDVLIALDLSESMLAEDLKPNRLLRARHEIGGIIDRLRGDRIGLVAFAGAAFVQCPLTLDYAAARMFLEFMGPDLIPEPGTSLAEALRVSTRAFDSDGDEFKALILISDGEDHAGEVEEAAREARRAGVRVFSVGIGSASGEPIPVRDSEGSIEGYKKDKSGKIILTRLNDDSLRRIAESTRGLYVRAGGTLGLDRVMKAIDQMDKKELEGGIRVLYEERYSYFLWPAIVLLLAQWWIPLRRRPKRGSGLSAPLLLCIALLAWAAGDTLAAEQGRSSGQGSQSAAEQGRSSGQESPSGPQEGALSDEEWTKQLEENEIYRSEHPDDPRPLYNLGNLYHLRGDFPQAQEFYEIGSGRAPGRLASQLAYNYGNNLHRQGNLLEAREVYAKALRLNQENEDAKLNLELTQLLLDQLSQMPDSSSQPGSCDQDSGDQKSDNQESGEDESPEDGSQGQEDSQPQERQEQSGEDSSEQDKQDEQDKQQDSSQQERGQEEYSQDQQDRRPDEEQDSQCDQESSDRSVAEPDSVVDLETMQLMQILKGLEATEKELLQKRFQARSRNTRVEKDW